MVTFEKINIDILNRSVPPVIDVVQNDTNTRGAEICLTCGGVPWSVPEGVTAAVAFRKEGDGKSGLYDQMPDGSGALTISDNTVKIIFAPEMMTAAGKVSVSVVFLDAELNRIATFPIVLRVTADPSAGQAVSNSYYRFATLDDINSILGEWLDDAETRIALKADDLYFDTGTSLLYLMSEGEIIGSGVQVATTGGGGGSAMSYTISMKNLLDSRVITVAEGTKVELKFSYASVDEDGMDDGPGIGRIIVGNATRQTFTAVQGENTVDVTEFLAAGSNVVKVQAENSEGAKKTLSYTVTVAAAYLASGFDASSPFTGDIPFTYTPTGIAEKTVHFELDGEELGTALVTSSGRQQSYTIPAQSHGSHSLKVWFECDIEGTAVTSNDVYFTLMCLEEGNTAPIIAVSAELLTSVEQYTNIVKKYRVYVPGSLTAAITLEANGETVANLTVDRTEQVWTYRPMEVGELVQTIRCGETAVSWTQTVTESSIQVEAETEALALHLSSYGRSNSEENPGVWESGNVACEFRNFNFVSDGWQQDEDDTAVLRVSGDARLYIPYRMFAYDFRTTGKTLEFELATRRVTDYDAVVISCVSGDRGFRITAQQLLLASEQSQLTAKYKEDEHIRVSFVAEKRSKHRLLLCYINGVMSGAVQYPEDDDFSQGTPVGITVGSNDCTTDLYNIRVYDNDLTRFQILDNWIADTQDPEKRVNRYLRNNIYDAYGQVTKSMLPTDLGRLTVCCPELPQFKGDKKTCSGFFEDLVHKERSFTFENAEIDVQGTSSQYYWRKNYKIKFKGGFILFDGSTAAVYAMNESAVPVSTFTMKADVASSEGYYNVVTAKLFNRYHPFKMPAQEADPRARYSIDGFPIVIFWDNGTETKFLGKYNFNNDKGTSEPFGLSPGDERWEVLQNGTDRVGFHSADFSIGDWKEDFEGNYPDGNTDTTNLQAMCAWVASTENDPEEFSTELAEHFVEEAVIYYYVFTEAFLCMDQREKNVLWRYIKAIQRWLADYYDADSIIGHNNQAQPVFDYWMEDIDYTASGDPVYNGQNSTFWKNLRATRADGIKAEWHRLRDAGFSYEAVMAAFEEHKSKWPEAIYNEDMQCKCLDALEQEDDGTYLPFLRGDKWAWTQQWLYKRFRYLDSKYEYGSSLENRATIRTNVMQNLTATYYMKLYGHVYYNAEHIAERVEKDAPTEFVSNASGAEDRVIGLNDADMITGLGDLAPHQVELIDLSKMVRLKSLKLGDGAESYVNNALASVTFGNNILLRKVDIRNCTALTQALDLSGCENIEEIYLDGTAVTGVSLPNGGILKVLHLPGTVNNLTLRNQTKLEDFLLPSYANITTLRLENNSDEVDPLAIFNAMADNSRVRIIGFDRTMTDSQFTAFIRKLDTMRGLDENGNNTDLAQVSGRIYIEEVNGSTLKKAEKYVGLTVEYGSAYLTSTKLVDRTLSGEYVNDRVTQIHGAAFYDTKITHISLPNVTTINSYANAIGGHFGLVVSADFPELTEIGSYQLRGQRELASVNIPKVVSIGGSGLLNSGLETIVLPSLTSIGHVGLRGLKLKIVDIYKKCSIGNGLMGDQWNSVPLLALILRGDEMSTIDANGLAYTGIESGTGYIYVPSALVDSYKSATNWSTYAAQFRALEDYTVDGTISGDLDETKI